MRNPTIQRSRRFEEDTVLSPECAAPLDHSFPILHGSSGECRRRAGEFADSFHTDYYHTRTSFLLDLQQRTN